MFTIHEEYYSSWIVYFSAMRYFAFVFFFAILKISAQNLVPNPSFEAYNPCNDHIVCSYKNITPCITSCCAAQLPEYSGMTYSGTYNWWSVGGFPATPYVNTCIYEYRNQYYNIQTNKNWYTPRTGESFVLINTYGIGNATTDNYRQYIQVRLTQPLQAGCTYDVSCYAQLTKNFGVFYTPINNHHTQTAADGLGIYLSQDSVYMINNTSELKAFTSITPQISNPSGHLLTDSIGYEKISGLYVAQGGEQWLVIGNFKDNANTLTAQTGTVRSVYSIDDVSVKEWKPELVSFIDSTVCEGTPLTVTLPDGLTNIKWSTGETTQSISVYLNHTYSVEASNGCRILSDTFTRHGVVAYTDSLSIGKDTFLCNLSEPFRILPNRNHYYKYVWSDGSSKPYLDITQPGTYSLEATYGCGIQHDTIQITKFNYPDKILLPNILDTTLCSNESLAIHTFDPYVSYAWSNSSSADHITVNSPGTYKLTATTTEGCTVTDSIRIKILKPPTVELPPDTFLCEGTMMSLVIEPEEGNTITWYDGSHSGHRPVQSTGNYWLNVTNRCFNVADTTHINFLDCTLEIPNLITANNDGMNDLFIIKTAIPRTLNVTIYNSWGTNVFNQNNYTNDWNAQDLNAGIYYYRVYDPLLQKDYKGWLQINR